jgi:membrane-associated phospholipid phosphatase
MHFDDRAWLTAGAVLGGAVLLMPLDEPMRTIRFRNMSPAGDDLFEIGRQYGREIYGLALSGGLYIGGLTFSDRELRTTGIVLFESIVFAGITTTIVKGLTGRSRPYLEEGQYTFRGFEFENDRNSFPSGHSTVAFSVSTALSARLKNSYATICLYSLATLTAVSRVYTDDHWLSDTFLGAVIGTVVGRAVVGLHEGRADRTSIHLTPTPRGLRLTYIF